MADVSKFSPDGGTTIYDIRDPKTMSAAESLTRDTTGWTGKNKGQFINACLSGSPEQGLKLDSWGSSVLARIKNNTNYIFSKKDNTGNRFRIVLFYTDPRELVGGDTTANQLIFDSVASHAPYTFNSGNYNYAVCTYSSDETISQDTAEAMLRDANNTDSTYEPYHPTVAEELSSRISTFNGRSGSVLPMAGDYDATQVNYSAQQTMKQKIDAVAGVWTSAVSCLVGDTTCTVNNSAIHITSIIDDVFTQTSSGNVIAYTNVAVTEGQAVITWASALTEAVSVKLHVLNL